MKQNSNFWLLFFGRLVSRLGDAIFTAGAGFFVLELTGSALLMASVMAAMTITMLVAGPIAGNVVDQFKKIKLLYIMDFIRGFVVLSTGLVIMFADKSSWIIIALYVMSVVVGLCTVVFNPASSAAIPLMMSKDKLMQANSYMAITGSLTNIIGLALGALIYSLIGPGLLFVFDGVSYILSGVSEMFIKIDEPDRRKNQEKNPFKDQWNMFKEGIAYLQTYKGLIYIGLFAAVLNLSLLPTFRVYQNVLIEEALGVDIIYLSIILIFTSSGSIIGSIMLTRNDGGQGNTSIVSLLKKYTFGLIVLIGLLGLVVQLVMNHMINFNWFMALYCFLGLIVGLMVAGVNIPIETYIQKNTEPSKMGRVNGVVNMLSMVTNPLGLLLGGLIVTLIPIQAAYLVSALMLLVNSSFLLFRKEFKKAI